MATFTLTGDMTDLLDLPLPARALSAHIASNASGGVLVVGDKVHLGGVRLPLQPDGTFSLAGIPAVDGIHYQVTASWVDPGTGKPKTKGLGWWPSPTTAVTVDLSALVTSDAMPVPEAAVVEQLLTARDEAVAAKDDAETAAASVQRDEPNGVAPLDGDRKLPEDNVPARLEASALDATYAGIPDNAAAAVGQGELIVNVKDYGAVGDGVTNDAAAINAAITAANAAASGQPAIVWFPWTPDGYGMGAPVPRSNVVLRGENRVTLKKVSASSAQWFNVAGVTNFTIENLTIDPNGLVTSAVMRAATGTTLFTVRNCKFQTSSALGASVNMYDTQASTSDLVIEDCWFAGCKDNIRINQGPQRVTIRRNLFTGWAERCIYVLGNATQAVTDLVIEHNVCRDMVTTGSVRQAITAQGQDAALHKRVRVNFNVVIGPGLSYTNPTTPGSADQISMHRCEDLEVIGNISKGGGDTGITIAMQCRRVVVASNICGDNDTVGIAIGSGGTTSLTDIAVTGNVFMNNGQNRQSDRPTAARAGLYLFGASSLAISGNRVGDDQGTKTQAHAYYLKNVTSARFAGNNDVGNVTGVYNLDTGNTDCTEALMLDGAGLVPDANLPTRLGGAALDAAYVGAEIPQAYGAVADGVTDDTAAVQAAIDASTSGSGVVYFPPGIYQVSGLTVTAHGTILRGAGRYRSFIESATGDVLTINNEYQVIDGLTLRSIAGGGHVVVVDPGAGALAQSRFVDCVFRQYNDDKNVWRFNDSLAAGGGMFDCHWIDVEFRHTTTATVPGFYVYGTAGNCFSANRFTRSRAHSSGTYFFDVQLDAASSYNYNNVWDTVNFEICNGGGIRMMSANGTVINAPGFFDNGTITGDMIRFDRLATRNQSRNNTVSRYHRSGGTLSGGAVDIHLVAGANAGSNELLGVGGTSGAGVTVNVGSGSGYANIVGYDPSFVTINNANPDRTVLVTAQNGIQAPKVVVGTAQIINGTGSPEGVVTAPQGAVYLNKSGGGGTTLYVKETGTGNTGWVPFRGITTATNGPLNLATNAINTSGKVAGKEVFNTVALRPVWATGSGATDVWVYADGTTAHTPA